MSRASMMEKKLALALCAAALAATSCFEAVRRPMFESIDIPGATFVAATDIDNRGRILGGFSTRGKARGFLIANRDTALIEVPDSDWTAVGGINSQSQIVGSYRDEDGEPHGYLLDKGRFHPIEFPGAAVTTPTDINNRGAISGACVDFRGVHGFVLKNGRFTKIDVPDAQRTNAHGINDLGFVVGDCVDYEDRTHGYILRNGEYQMIDVPGAIYGTSVKGINTSGKVVGGFIDETGLHGFVWDRGVFTTIDFPGAKGTIAVSINDRGDIAGEYTDQAGRGHGFVMRMGSSKSPLPTAPKLAAAGHADAASRARLARAPSFSW